jgi:hypothetical protein
LLIFDLTYKSLENLLIFRYSSTGEQNSKTINPIFAQNFYGIFNALAERLYIFVLLRDAESTGGGN